MKTVPESAAPSARSTVLTREAARRREAVTMLRITEATARYASVQLSNGIGPAEARETALFVAGELTAVARRLRRLARPSAPAERRRNERREVARRLRGEGLPVRVIAARLGVTHPTVLRDLGRRDSTAVDC